MSRNCNGCDSLFVDWYEPVIGKSYCEDCAEERNYAGMIETANSLSEALDCLVEASAALTRYRTLTGGNRLPMDDLTLYEWLTSIVPRMDTKDSPEQVMRKVLKDGKYLWVRSWTTEHMLDAEHDRAWELLHELGYEADEED